MNIIISKLFGLTVYAYHVAKYGAGMVGELTTGGFLVTQTEPPFYGTPLGGEDSLHSEIKHLAVKERDLLITESMDIHGTDGPYCNVRGLTLRLMGTDTMKFYLQDKLACTIRNHRGSSGYSLYRGGIMGEKIGRIDNDGDGYGFYPEAVTASTEFSESTKLANAQPVAAYTLSGDFINRRFLMRNVKGKNVAKIKKKIVAFPHFSHYTVRIAPGMDPILVLACLCVIDEDLEEQFRHKLLSAPKKVFSATKLGLSYVNPFW